MPGGSFLLVIQASCGACFFARSCGATTHGRAPIPETTTIPNGTGSEGRRWLLLVEDDEPLARVLAEALRGDGWTVAVISDGLEAFGAIRKALPDVVVLDLNLPQLYGQVLLRALKRDPATAAIPIIVATGHPELLTEQDRPLAAAVLHKPFSLDRLLAAAEAARRAT